MVVRVLCVALMGLMLAGCETGWRGWEEIYEPQPAASDGGWTTDVQQLGGVEPSGAPAPGTSNFSSTLNDYRIGSGDQLRITVFGQDDLTGEYKVDGLGRISMPLISQVEVGGTTTGDVERLVEARLRQGFLRDPHVSVEVLTFRPFFVLGEVQTAGQYPYVNGMTVQNAIAIGGGYTTRANTGEVIVTRQTTGGPVTVRVAPTEAVLPGDTIYVRERWF
jgi:polysaccharide export outer membrane protein